MCAGEIGSCGADADGPADGIVDELGDGLAWILRRLS